MIDKNLTSLLKEVITGPSLVALKLFGARPETGNLPRHAELPKRVEGRIVQVKGQRMVQFSYVYPNRVTHRNMTQEDSAIHFQDLLEEQFRQAEMHTTDAEYTILINRKKQAAITRRPTKRAAPVQLTHDRPKEHILSEGTPYDFLVRLGVMTAEGKVIAAKFDKFRQVNRFLEMVRDVAEELEKGRPIQIVDFGCGKSYLTFALYHYLRTTLGLDARILGLDLKADVIADCQQIATDLKYEHLTFQVGDIQSSKDISQADMVVCLHACDTATDDALARAVQWNTKVILAVPCCQKELFRQVQNETLRPMLKHGIVKERLASLITDSARAQLLETVGYSVQMLEFIETEHTPKNILIRAVRRPNPKKQEAAQAEYARLRDFWQIAPSLEQQLKR